MSRLGGVILAAGLSSRMKQFKPLMMIDGKSMIRHVIDLMRGAGAETIVVVTGITAHGLKPIWLTRAFFSRSTPIMRTPSNSNPCASGCPHYMDTSTASSSPPPMCRWFRRKPFATCLRSPGTSCDPCITEKPDTPSFWTLLSFPC